MPGSSTPYDRPRRRTCRRIAAFIVGCAAMLGIVEHTQADANDGEILFYDPDANHQAIMQISKWFNGFLGRSKLGLRFVPVQKKNALEAALRGDNAHFAVISSEYLSKSGGSFLTAILVPAASGDVYYRKVLLDRGGARKPDYTNQTIAATLTAGAEQTAGQKLLDSLEKADIPCKGARILRMSKDVDGVLALALGDVDAAVVTRKSLAVLRKINPSVAASLRIVTETAGILRSPLCVHRNFKARNIEAVVSAFLKMGQDATGKRAMTAMGFDSWERFSPSMLKLPGGYASKP